MKSEKWEFKKSNSEAINSMKLISVVLNKFGEGVIYYGIQNDGTVVLLRKLSLVNDKIIVLRNTVEGKLKKHVKWSDIFAKWSDI